MKPRRLVPSWTKMASPGGFERTGRQPWLGVVELSLLFSDLAVPAVWRKIQEQAL